MTVFNEIQKDMRLIFNNESERKEIISRAAIVQLASGIIICLGTVLGVIGVMTFKNNAILGGAAIVGAIAVTVLAREVFIVSTNTKETFSNSLRRIAAAINTDYFVKEIFKNTWLLGQIATPWLTKKLNSRVENSHQTTNPRMS